jgi:molecular chaperone GrpE
VLLTAKMQHQALAPQPIATSRASHQQVVLPLVYQPEDLTGVARMVDVEGDVESNGDPVRSDAGAETHASFEGAESLSAVDPDGELRRRVEPAGEPLSRAEPTEKSPSQMEPTAEPPGEAEPAAGSPGERAHAAADAPEVNSLLEAVSGQLAELRRMFDERLRQDVASEESFRHLYDDLEQFRALAGTAGQKPILSDIILLLDRVEKGLEAQPEDEFIESIRGELVEILARRGVSAMIALEDRFDPLRQRAVGTREAPEEAAHNMIAEVARTGYECNGQVLRATEVTVYRYKPGGGSGEASGGVS